MCLKDTHIVGKCLNGIPVSRIVLKSTITMLNFYIYGHIWLHILHAHTTYCYRIIYKLVVHIGYVAIDDHFRKYAEFQTKVKVEQFCFKKISILQQVERLIETGNKKNT